jgi:glycosyltransferase involved in cell wall biosynthesis
MSRDPLVSAIIIFLNEERFLQEAIESVLAQTYDNWELLLIDDGSTDGSTETAQRYVAQYPEKVRYLDHEGHQNRGMTASRNLGIRHASGEYAGFLDADDIWLPHKLEQQVAILESTREAALVCGRAQWWYGWTGNQVDIRHDFAQRFDVPPDTLVQPPVLLIQFLQNEWTVFHDILVRREVLEAVGGYEESFRGIYQAYEDQALQSKLFLDLPAFVSDACWCRYRQHPEAHIAISQRTGQKYLARQFFLNWLETYLTEHNSRDSAVWQVVQEQLWPYRHPTLCHLRGGFQHLVRRMQRLMLDNR